MEEQFKNKLKTHRVTWDKEELLEGLEIALAKEEKSSKKVWFLLLLLPLILVAGYLMMHDFDNAVETDLVAGGQQSVTKSKVESTQEVLIDNTKILANKTGKIVVESTENSQEAVAKYANPESNLKKDNYKTNHAISTAEIAQTKELKSTQTVQHTLPQTPIQSTREVLTSTPNPISVSQLNKINTKIYHKPIITKTANNLLPSNNEKYTGKLINIAFVPAVKLFPFTNPTPHIPVASTLTTDTATTETKKLQFFVESNTSVGLLQTDFSSSYAGYADYLEEKSILETAILHDAISLEVGALINEKWSVQIGLEYQEMRERFKYDLVQSSDTSLVEYDKAYYTLTPELDTTFISAIVPKVESEVRRVKHWNKHTYLTIPVTVSRRFKINNTMINASAGISYALQHSFTGRTKTQLDRITETDKFWLKNKVGYHFAIGGEHPLSNNKVLFLRTIFRSSPVLGFDEIAEKSHLSYSLGLGVRFYLSGNASR